MFTAYSDRLLFSFRMINWMIPFWIFDVLEMVVNKTTNRDARTVQNNWLKNFQDCLTENWLNGPCIPGDDDLHHFCHSESKFWTRWSSLNWLNCVFLLVKTVFLSKYFSIDQLIIIFKLLKCNNWISEKWNSDVIVKYSIMFDSSVTHQLWVKIFSHWIFKMIFFPSGIVKKFKVHRRRCK